MVSSSRTPLWTLSLLTVLAACEDGGETPRDGADAGSTIDSASIDARVEAGALLPDGAVVDRDGQIVWVPDPRYEAGTPPGAGFALSDTRGAGTLWVKATSSATPGSAPIVETLYDFGEGAGFTAASTHRYQKPGSFTVRQQVRDAAGQLTTSTATVTLDPFTPVRFSATDHSPYIHLSADGTLVENRFGLSVARTDGSIPPGSGVFYFEGEYLTAVRVGGFGLATADAPLDQGSGGNALSLGYEAYGPLRSTGSSCTGATEIDRDRDLVGFVIDYRAASPVVHFVQGATATVIASCTMAVTTPLFATYWSERAAVGYEGRINTGADTVNMPFAFGLDALKAALTSAGHSDAAAVLVPGFGRTRAGRKNELPTLDVPASITVPYGQAVTLSGSARDSEDGDLSAQIAWVDTASLWHARVGGVGASFSFTPSSIGRHPVTATAIDGDGGKVEKTVEVVVTGTLPQANPVKLALDATSGQGITLSADGLSATFAGPAKDGVKANQGLYGDFWYFEVHRINPIRNMGHGLMVGEGSLNPYAYDEPAWSVSLNVSAGIWRELIPYASYTPVDSDVDYGWAVDYRGTHPKVYLIVRGMLMATYDLQEVWTPLYPIVYGNIAYPSIAGPDMSINFGTAPFAFNAKAILAASGIDVSAMKLGWGVHAQ